MGIQINQKQYKYSADAHASYTDEKLAEHNRDPEAHPSLEIPISRVKSASPIVTESRGNAPSGYARLDASARVETRQLPPITTAMIADRAVTGEKLSSSLLAALRKRMEEGEYARAQGDYAKQLADVISEAEDARVAAEEDRCAAEAARVTAEADRDAAETERVEAEIERVEAEKKRASVRWTTALFANDMPGDAPVGAVCFVTRSAGWIEKLKGKKGFQTW